MVSFFEKKSLPRPKPRAMPRHRMAQTPHAQPGPEEGHVSVPVPVEGPMQKSRTAEECCVHSFCATGRAPRHRRCEVGGRARRRSFCVRCTPFISEASIPAAEGACTHAMLAHHTVLTCVLTSCARRRWKGSAAHIQWISLTVQVVVSWIWCWCMLLCNGSRRFAACVDRERSPDRPLITRVQHAL